MASCTVLQVAIRGLDSWFNSIFNNLPAILQPTDDVVVVSPLRSLQPAAVSGEPSVTRLMPFLSGRSTWALTPAATFQSWRWGTDQLVLCCECRHPNRSRSCAGRLGLSTMPHLGAQMRPALSHRTR